MKAKPYVKLIAPCGMNCALCVAFQRDKNKCPGCNFQGKSDSDYFKKCSVKNCNMIKENKWKHCSPTCEKFPCKRLKTLDKRYKSKYRMSMIENLNFIQKQGIRKFIAWQKSKWTCKKCKNLLCVHKPDCIYCQNSN